MRGIVCSVMAGLVPAIPLRDARCPPKRDHRDIRAFTPVFDGLCPVMTDLIAAEFGEGRLDVSIASEASGFGVS